MSVTVEGVYRDKPVVMTLNDHDPSFFILRDRNGEKIASGQVSKVEITPLMRQVAISVVSENYLMVIDGVEDTSLIARVWAPYLSRAPRVELRAWGKGRVR